MQSLKRGCTVFCDAPDQRINDLRRKLSNVRIVPQCFHQQPQIHIGLLRIQQLFLAVSYELQQFLLLFFVVGGHFCKTLIGDFSGDIRFKQPFNGFVDSLDAPFTGGNDLLQLLHLGLSCSGIVFCQQIQENRLIAPHKVCKTTHRFRHDLLQHHISDIVNIASPSSGIVVGAAVKFLIGFQTLGGAEVQLSSAVGAKQQARKQARPSGFVFLRLWLRSSCTRSNSSSDMIGSCIFGMICCSSTGL